VRVCQQELLWLGTRCQAGVCLFLKGWLLTDETLDREGGKTPQKQFLIPFQPGIVGTRGHPTSGGGAPCSADGVWDTCPQGLAGGLAGEQPCLAEARSPGLCGPSGLPEALRCRLGDLLSSSWDPGLGGPSQALRVGGKAAGCQAGFSKASHSHRPGPPCNLHPPSLPAPAEHPSFPLGTVPRATGSNQCKPHIGLAATKSPETAFMGGLWPFFTPPSLNIELFLFSTAISPTQLPKCILPTPKWPTTSSPSERIPCPGDAQTNPRATEGQAQP